MGKIKARGYMFGVLRAGMSLHKATLGVRVRRDKESSKNEHLGPPTLGQEGAGKGRASTLMCALCPWSWAVHNLCGPTRWSGAEETLKDGAEKQLGGQKGVVSWWRGEEHMPGWWGPRTRSGSADESQS